MRGLKSNVVVTLPWRRATIGRVGTAPTTADRVLGCLKGIAIGDAIGKQTETLSRPDITRWYPNGVGGFEGSPGRVIPRYVGNTKYEWRSGETTDDTERTIAVARAIIRERRVAHESIGREMLGCRKCVHPGVKSLWEFHDAGDPARIATLHDGCGAAVRVAPVGIVHRASDLDALAILVATNIGGDSDSVASIAGGILGARYPDTVNDQWYAVVDRVNDHELEALADQLLILRG